MLKSAVMEQLYQFLEGGNDLNVLKESTEAHVGTLLEFNWKFKITH